MALVVKDRVKETTTTTGTSTYTLGGAVTGFETFTSNLSNADTTYYVCTDGTDFEVGIGTFTSSGTTLARTTILASSNSNNAVNWSSGTREIFITYPADKSVFKDASNNINGTFVGNITGNVTGNADTATVATTVTITDNENTNEDNAIIFTAGGDVDGGNLGLESDGDLIYNPSTGRLTATQLAGTLQTAAQTNITSVGTLSSLTTSGDITVGDDLTVEGGQIDLRSNSGAVGKMKFYCEVSNAHAQTLQAQPHSASSSAVLTLPVNTGTLVGTGDTGSVSNTMLAGSIANDKLAGSIANAKLANSSITVSDGSNTTAVALGGTVTFAGTSNEVEVAESSGTITIGLPDNVTIGGNLTVSGTTTTVNSTTVNLNDHNIVLDSGNSTSAVVDGAGITIEGGTGTDASFLYSTTGPKFELKLGSDYEDLQVDQLIAASLDISGNVDVDGTLEADAITVDGTALNTVIAGVTVTNATNATNATHVSVADNESTNEDNLIPFIEDTSATGNVGLESDGDFHYNPSTGRLTATQLSGTLQTAAQANITSLGTLTTLTVDNVIINGSTIGHTGDTDLMTVASGVLTVAGEVDATSLDISGDADIDGTLEADAITVNGTALNTVISDEATALAIALG